MDIDSFLKTMNAAAPSLEEVVDSYCDVNASSEATTAKLNHVLMRVHKSEIDIQSLVAALGPYLSHKDPLIRSRGTLLLSEVLTRLPSLPLTSDAVAYLVHFHCARLQDFPTVVEVLMGVRALVAHHTLPDDGARLILSTIFTELNVQALAQSARLSVFQLFEMFLGDATHLDHVRPMGADFVFGFVQAMDGERDPRNLVILFSLLPRVVEEFPEYTRFKDDLFEVVACYFPISFRRRPDDPLDVDADTLSSSLRSCLCATPAFAEHSLPLFFEKITSSVETSQVEGLRALVEAAQKWGVGTLEAYTGNIWSTIRTTCTTTESTRVIEQCLYSIREITSVYARDPTARTQLGDTQLSSWLSPLMTECRHQLQDTDSKVALLFGKVLLYAGSASVVACVRILESALPVIFSRLLEALPEPSSDSGTSTSFPPIRTALLTTLISFIQATETAMLRDAKQWPSSSSSSSSSSTSSSLLVTGELHPIRPYINDLFDAFSSVFSVGEGAALLTSNINTSDSSGTGNINNDDDAVMASNEVESPSSSSSSGCCSSSASSSSGCCSTTSTSTSAPVGPRSREGCITALKGLGSLLLLSSPQLSQEQTDAVIERLMMAVLASCERSSSDDVGEAALQILVSALRRPLQADGGGAVIGAAIEESVVSSFQARIDTLCGMALDGRTVPAVPASADAAGATGGGGCGASSCCKTQTPTSTPAADIRSVVVALTSTLRRFAVVSAASSAALSTAREPLLALLRRAFDLVSAGNADAIDVCDALLEFFCNSVSSHQSDEAIMDSLSLSLLPPLLSTALDSNTATTTTNTTTTITSKSLLSLVSTFRLISQAVSADGYDALLRHMQQTFLPLLPPANDISFDVGTPSPPPSSSSSSSPTTSFSQLFPLFIAVLASAPPAHVVHSPSCSLLAARERQEQEGDDTRMDTVEDGEDDIRATVWQLTAVALRPTPSLGDESDVVGVSACKGIASIVNKAPDDVSLKTYLRVVVDRYLTRAANGEVVTASRKESVRLLGWIAKGLCYRMHPTGFRIVLDSLSELLDDADADVAAASLAAFGVVLSDYEGLLSRRSKAKVVLLFRQKLFAQCVPRLFERFNTTQSSAQLEAMSMLLRHVPKSVLLSELPKVFPVIVRSLSSDQVSLSLTAVELLCSLEDSTADIITPHMHSIVKALLRNTTDMRSRSLRIGSLRCMARIPSLVPYSTIYPHKRDVLEGLGAAVGDPKREVRQQAVRCRNGWYVMKSE